MARRVPLAPEGWIFIIPVCVLAAASLLIQWYIAAIILGGVAAFLFNFFRDPARPGSEHHVDILSPADGTVVQIRDYSDPEWPQFATQISIFMSVFDVHVNRAPITGKIVHYQYNRGAKLSAISQKSSLENEQNFIVMQGEHTTIAFKQIAGLLARRIVFDKKEGDVVARGARVGMIRFGSRVDLFLPANAILKVKMRDKVKVALTVVAEVETK